MFCKRCWTCSQPIRPQLRCGSKDTRNTRNLWQSTQSTWWIHNGDQQISTNPASGAQSETGLSKVVLRARPCGPCGLCGLCARGRVVKDSLPFWVASQSMCDSVRTFEILALLFSNNPNIQARNPSDFPARVVLCCVLKVEGATVTWFDVILLLHIQILTIRDCAWW